MGDSTAEQKVSNSQPQGTSEKTTEKKEKNSFPQAQSQLSRRKKIILGIATFGIIFYTGVSFLASNMIGNPSDFDLGSGIANVLTLSPLLIYLYPIIILSLVVTLIYLISVFKNKRIFRLEKTFWVVIFFHGFFYPININPGQNGGLFQMALESINLVIFLIMPYIAMSIYWYRYIWEGTRLKQLIKRRYWYVYALIVLYIVIYLIPVEISMVTESGFYKAGELKIQQLKEFENAKMVKAYLPSTLKSEWGLPQISSDGGVVKVSVQKVFPYVSVPDLKSVGMVEIVSPKTDLKCNNETLIESDKMFSDKMFIVHYYSIPVADKSWLTDCEEVLVAGEKTIIGSYERDQNIYKNSRTNPPSEIIRTYHIKKFLMVFDKGSTRIYLHYWQRLQDYLMGTEGWSKSDLIKLVENLRPIEAKDFGL